MALEIERKFIMNTFPNQLRCLGEVHLEQGYISIEPEIRIHKATDIQNGMTQYRLTVKGDGDLSRTEIKTEVDRNFYNEIVEFIGKPMIQKRYKRYQLGEHILEVSQVDPGTPWEFYYGEIEFSSEEEAKGYQPPEFLGQDVTQKADYKMKHYWKRTRCDRG